MAVLKVPLLNDSVSWDRVIIETSIYNTCSGCTECYIIIIISKIAANNGDKYIIWSC